MLKIFRRKEVAKMILWGILILILPAFVIWGSGSLGGSKEKGPKFVGTIKKKKVSFEEFATAIMAMRSQLILSYYNQPRAVEAIMRNPEVLGRLAWGRIIMLREARARKIKIPNNELIAGIRNHPLFVKGGRFDDGIYNYFLKYNLGIDPRTFEETVRENIAIQRMNDDLTKDVTAADEDVREIYGKDNNRFKILYAFVPAASFADKAQEATDEEIRNYYEARKEDFVILTKEAEAKEVEKKYSKLEDVKDEIKAIVAEIKAIPLAGQHAEKEQAKVKETMETEKRTFAYACEKAGLKAQETPFFSKLDNLEGVGEARPVAEEAARLKIGEVSQAVETRRGACFFVVTETSGFDEEKFKKEKDEYAQRALVLKKNKYLEDWLRRQETDSALNIDLAQYEKYYR